MDLTEINLHQGSLPDTRCDVARKLKSCIRSSAVPVRFTGHRELSTHSSKSLPVPWWQTAARSRHMLPEQHVPPMPAAALECLRRFILVCQPAPSCCLSLLVLSVERDTSRSSGKTLLGVRHRSVRLPWQAAYQLFCGDLCYSLVIDAMACLVYS